MIFRKKGESQFVPESSNKKGQFTGIACLATLHFMKLQRQVLGLLQIEGYGKLVSSKSMGAYFPIAFAHSMSLVTFWYSHNIAKFSLLLYLL